MIEIKALNKYYNRGKSNQIHVINNVTLSLPESGMVAIFGKSGCGKTTLLNTIGGLDTADDGLVAVFGEKISPNNDELRNKYIGCIFQNYNLCKQETVFENVANALRLCGMTDRDEIYRRVTSALANVGMDKYLNRTPDTLSGGQQQRVAIARALVKNPQIILADEPTGNLDEANTLMVMDILKELSKSRLILLVTHEAELVDHYCDKVIEIVDGAINSIRENENADGHFQKDKNHIYLGELQKSETSANGVHIEYYGEPNGEISIKLVSEGGRLYLKCDDPKVRIIDDSSEIKLKEGVYAPTPLTVSASHIDMSQLTPFEGKKYGRLFGFSNAFSSARNSYKSSKKKKSNRFLRIVLATLAIVMVFMSSNFAVGIGKYLNVSDNHSDNSFFIPMTVDTDLSHISNSIGQNGLLYARIVGSDVTENAYETIGFSFKNFMSTENLSIFSASGTVLDISVARGLNVVSGNYEFKSLLDTVITTAVADELITNADLSFIKDYDDLIGLTSSSQYYNSEYIRIIGVVESDEKAFFFSSLSASQIILSNQYGNMLHVTAASLSDYNDDIPLGSVAVQYDPNYLSDEDLDSIITILGKKFSLINSQKIYTNMSDYHEYVYEKYSIKLLEYHDYIEEKKLENSLSTSMEWFFDYYSKYLNEYIDILIKNTYVDIELWAYSRTTLLAPKAMIANMYYLNSAGFTDEYVYFSLKYHELYGKYPTLEQLDKFYNDSDTDEYYLELDSIWDYYNEYSNDNYSYNSKGQASFILNDEDYISLVNACGKCSKWVYGYGASVYDYEYYYHEQLDDGTEWYEHHMLIYASNAEEAEAYLCQYYDENTLITPSDTLEIQFSDSIQEILQNSISLLLVTAVMFICVFLLMRTTIMDRVKEIGIYRAIGVSKKNLVFRFFIETLVLTGISVLIGFIISSILVSKLAAYSLLADVFYYPVWFAAIVFIFLVAAIAISGTLPVIMLLRRTPSEIIAKYDI